MLRLRNECILYILFYLQQNPSNISSTTPKKTSDFSHQPQSGSISNYEKALLSAATSIYQQHKGSSGGGSNYSSYNIKNMPFWKQKRIQAQQNKDPNKPIVVCLCW